MTVVNRAFDVLLWPFRSFPPIVGLAVVSAVLAVAVLLVFKRTSNQRRMDDVKRQTQAALFEIRLFNDDLRAILRAAMEMLRHTASYLRLSLIPMVWLAIPLLLVLAQLQFHYGYSAPAPGEPMLVKAVLRGAAPAGSSMRLEAPDAIRIDTPAVWIPAAREVVWRIAALERGAYELRIRIGDETISKTIDTRADVVRRSPVRTGGLLNRILYPSEPSVPSSSQVESLSVQYREANVAIFGWEIHWMVVLFILSSVFALALRGPLHVTI